jgi:CheY-like chemotaxis protein
MSEVLHPGAAEAVLDGLLAAVPGGVVHVGADGAVMRANPAAVAFLGMSYDQLTHRYTQDFEGETWFEDGTICPAEQYPVTLALVTGEPAGPTTIGVRQPSGEVRWAVFRALPVEGGGAVVAFLDITERRETEQRLRDADRLAALGRLATGVAHEVNNPLAYSILALERALIAEDAVPDIRVALEGLRRIESLVRDIQSEDRTPGAAVQEVARRVASMGGKRRGRVLVVDDEPRIGQMMNWALRSHDVVVAAGGREALDRLQNESFDVVICDLMMPEVTGMDVHAEVARSWPELLPRLLFMTGGAYADRARAFLARPDIRYLHKPFQLDELRDAVQEIVDRSE